MEFEVDPQPLEREAEPIRLEENSISLREFSHLKTESTPTSIRKALNLSEFEQGVFAMGSNSQPHHQRRPHEKFSDSAHRTESRAIHLARESDIVVVAGTLDRDYLRYLRDIGRGTSRIVEYPDQTGWKSLAQIISEQPERLRAELIRSEKIPVYLPYYSGQAEAEAATVTGCRFFGCAEDVSLRYFNKHGFKEICKVIGLPTVPGLTVKIHGADSNDPTASLKLAVNELLKHSDQVIVRGTDGCMGGSVYRVDATSLDKLCSDVIRKNEVELLVETLLPVEFSPNDQWVVNSNGEIFRAGDSVQVFDGFKYRGNVGGDDAVPNHLQVRLVEMSKRIAERMRDDGYVGVFGVDYITTRQGQIFPIENNARVNGSSFAVELVRSLETSIGGIPAWKTYRASGECQSFEGLKNKLGSLLFDGRQTNCVIPVHCGKLQSHGQWTPLIIAENRATAELIELELEVLGFQGP